MAATDSAPLRLARKLQQRRCGEERGLCLVEGFKCLKEALRMGPPVAVFFSARAAGALAPLSLARDHAHEVAEKTLAALCSTATPEGVLAIVRRPPVAAGLPAGQPGSLHLALYEWRDPANTGAVVRCARGLGAASVLQWGEGPDFFSPKVIRASMGSVFHLPLARLPAREQPPETWACFYADASASRAPARLARDRPNLLVVGGEAHGLPEGLRSAPGALAIEMSGGLESLSAPIAAALLLDRLRGRIHPENGS